jgi:uncharacterized protein
MQNRGNEVGSAFEFIVPLLFFLFFAFLASRARRRGVVYNGRGSRGIWIGPMGGGWGGDGGWRGGGGWGGGGGGGGGGGFSGGGGDSGGGGASGGW